MDCKSLHPYLLEFDSGFIYSAPSLSTIANQVAGLPFGWKMDCAFKVFKLDVNSENGPIITLLVCLKFQEYKTLWATRSELIISNCFTSHMWWAAVKCLVIWESLWYCSLNLSYTKTCSRLSLYSPLSPLWIQYEWCQYMETNLTKCP